MILEIANAVTHVVSDFDCASGVHCIGKQNLEIPETMSDMGFVLQFLTRGVGDANDINNLQGEHEREGN